MRVRERETGRLVEPGAVTFARRVELVEEGVENDAARERDRVRTSENEDNLRRQVATKERSGSTPQQGRRTGRGRTR